MGRMLSSMLQMVRFYSTSLPSTYIYIPDEALGGGSTASHVNHETAIHDQQPKSKSEQSCDDCDALRQEVQSVLCRTSELERRMGIARNYRSVRRERIQLGLEIVVADNGLRAHGFPFLILILAIITVMMVLNAYKYAFST
jgi:hypothetical protein